MRMHGLALLIATVALAAACNKDRRGVVTPKIKDASAGPMDASIIPPGCEANPSGCVEHQLLAGDCSCLAACETDYVWNGSACDQLEKPDSGNGGGDTGPNPNDTGVESDSGMDAGTPIGSDTGVGDTGPGDTGTPPIPACTVNTDCPGATPACIDTMTLEFCNGRPNCACTDQCDPYATNNSCSGAEVCTWLGVDPNSPLGLCFPDQGGGTQGQSCNTQYDAMGNVTSDSCNRTRNSFCIGASPQSPVGVCSTICGTNNPSRCTGLGNFVCDNLGDATSGFGLCLEPAPNFTDIGISCTVPTTCQGNLCSQTLAGSCSAMCGGLASCPANSFCLNLPSEGPSCAQGCTHDGVTGDDAFCQGRNPATVCENLGATDPLGICIPACQDSAQCGAGSTCVDGHCT